MRRKKGLFLLVLAPVVIGLLFLLNLFCGAVNFSPAEVNALTDALGFSPYSKLTCSDAPPLVSTLSKQPISMITGAMVSNWSLRGTYLPELCHMSRYTKLNFISFFMFLIIWLIDDMIYYSKFLLLNIL